MTIELLTYSVDACHALGALLEEENACLEARDLEQMERIIREKERLSVRLEKHLSVVRQNTDEIKALGNEAKPHIEAFNDAIKGLEQTVRRNAVLLEARHQGTLNFLNALRQAVSAPKAQTYGHKGQMTEKGDEASLVRKEI